MPSWKKVFWGSASFGAGFGAGLTVAKFLPVRIWIEHLASLHLARGLMTASTVVAEVLVAAVIYYEVEEHRASTFMSEIQSAEVYRERAEIYDEYARLPANNLKDRAEQFRKLLWTNENLRETCDLQWTYFNRLRYIVRHSLFHRRLVSTWFPQVLVSFWVMTSLYLRERQQLRPTPITSYGLIAVRESLGRLKKQGLRPLTIYSRDGNKRVEVSVAELEQMIADLDAPFR